MKGLESLAHSEHMTENEIGQHAEQFHQDLALLQHQQGHAIDPAAVSAEWCEACDCEIPELRRKAVPGVTLCIDCAREAEIKERMYR